MEKFFLPSEISRLVLGYIEEQNCPAAAQSFLDSCPHLRECAEAAQRGRHFSTRVSGKNLTDILDEFCLTYTLVQDRIQKLPENVASQIRNSCGTSLSEQVKHLLDGKLTSQRFHVNITVPTQGVSPSSITSPGGLNSSHHGQRSKSRIRRANHQIQEQRLMLRSQDPLEDVTASVTVQRIEATQLENLPGSSTVDKECFSSRRNILSTVGEKNRTLGTSETAKTDHEEENLSLIDPKTGELIPRLSDASHSIPTPNVNETSITKEVNVQHSSLNNNIGVSSFVGQNPAAKVHFETPSAVESPCSVNAIGRSSIDNIVMDILSTHTISDNSQFQNKDSALSQPSGSELERSGSGPVVHTNKEGATLGEEHHCKVPRSSQNLGHLQLGTHGTPNPKDPQNSIHETVLQTPKRSGAKRKTKPTPLKLITPTKHKTGCDSSDSGEVVVDPKLFFGPLLDNRQLHEKIAENINQFICSSGNEADSEVKEINTPEAVVTAPAITPSTSTSGETFQELEKAIKTVVDKTEADPLFERLLNEILGPEYDDDDCSSIIMPTSPEDKSSQVESFVGEQDTNIAKSSISGEDEKKDPLSLLQDQNEAAIKSILEAQPEGEDMPKKGKTVLTRGGLCKNRGFSRNHSVKIVRGRPSGACNPIFAEPEIIGDGRGKDEEGAVTSILIENRQASGNDVKKLIILPVADLEPQPITYPTIILNGVSQFIVPVASNQSFNPKYKPIAPKEKIEGTPGNPTILQIAPPEEAKDIVCKPTVGPIGASELTSISNPIGKTSLGSTVLHGSTSISEQHHTVCTVPMSNQGLPSLLEPDTEIGTDLNKSILSQASEQILNTGKDATPNVISSRVTRAATESRLPILEKAPRVTPQMAAGNRRASLSTPRRNRASGHVRALNFGNTPPKPVGSENSLTEVLTDSICEGVTSVLQNENLVKQIRHPVPSKKMRKELQKTMDISEKSPDPTVCIATRSPPPRLSGAWNKVGVDLIFGDNTSPAKPSQSPTLRSSLLLENEVPTKDGEATASQKDNNTTGSLFKWESSKSKVKSTWDADLRAIISSSQEKPKLTKKQQKSIDKKAKALQKATDTSSKKKDAKNARESSKDESEETEKPAAKGRRQKSGEEMDRLKGKKLNKSKEEDDNEEENEVNLDAENPNNDDEKESEQLPAKGKRKRRSGGAKKKGARAKKLQEKSLAIVETDESSVSPEKVWVVQQSPGSWANKRSLHESIPNLTATDSEMGNLTIGAARRHLDLQETPRKPGSPDLSKGGIHTNDLVQKHLLTCDRSALTVVETPLFPPTPNVNGMSTPIGQDLSEVVETFPSYFKPRDKESSADPGRETMSQTNGIDIKTVSQSKVSGSCCTANNSKDGSLVEEHEPSVGNVGPSSEASNKVDDTEGAVGKDLADTVVADEKEKIEQLPKTTTRKNVRKSKARKPAARRPPAGKQKKATNAKRNSKNVDDSIGGEQQESLLAEKEDDEQPQKRVLRPRKNKATYQEEPVEESKNKEGVYEKESLEEWNDCPPITSQRRRRNRASRASIEVPPPVCNTVSVDEIDEGLVFEPLAQVDVNAQTQEAEVLAKAIVLKLSPMAPKPDMLEEEEESDEDTINISGPIIRNQNHKAKNIRRIMSTSSSASSSNSSSSDSSSSSSSSEDEDDEQRLNVDITRPSEASAKAGSELNECHDKIGKAVAGEKGDGSAVDASEAKESIEIKKKSIEKDGERTKEVEESAKAKEVSKREGRIVEIEKGEESITKIVEPRKMVEVLHSPEFGIVGRRISIDDKKRRDNLEKILFGTRNLEEEDEAVDVDGETTSVNLGLSLADRNLVNELELKRQRTLERLKGGKRGRKVCAGRRHTAKQNLCPPPSSLMAAFLESPKHLNISSDSQCRNVANLEKSPIAQRKDKSFNDKNMFPTQPVDEEDCLILRLSEGDDTEVKSPYNTTMPSPSKFDLLNSLEEQLAQLHGDISPTIRKKTARMSCTPASIHLTERTLEMEHSSPAEAVLINNNNNGKALELQNASCLESENLQMLEQEPVPSTSKAADHLLKAAERKHAHQMGLVHNSNRESGVTFRNRNRIKQNESEKSTDGSTTSRALRSNQSDITDDVDLNVLTGSTVPPAGDKKRASRSQKKASSADIENNSPVATRRSKSLPKVSVTPESEANETAAAKTEIVNKKRQSSNSKTHSGRNSQVTPERDQNYLANISCDRKDLEASCKTLVKGKSVNVRSRSANPSSDKSSTGLSSLRNDALNSGRGNLVDDLQPCATSEKTKNFGSNHVQDDGNVSDGFSLALSDTSLEDGRATGSPVVMQSVIGETVEDSESDAVCNRGEKGKNQKMSPACSLKQSDKSLLRISKSSRIEISDYEIEEVMDFVNLGDKNREEKRNEKQPSDSIMRSTSNDSGLSNLNKDGEKSGTGKTSKPCGTYVLHVISPRTSEVNKKQTFISKEEVMNSSDNHDQTNSVEKISCGQELGDSKIQMGTSSESYLVKKQSLNPISKNGAQLTDSSVERVGKMGKTSKQLKNSTKDLYYKASEHILKSAQSRFLNSNKDEECLEGNVSPEAIKKVRPTKPTVAKSSRGKKSNKSEEVDGNNSILGKNTKEICPIGMSQEQKATKDDSERVCQANDDDGTPSMHSFESDLKSADLHEKDESSSVCGKTDGNTSKNLQYEEEGSFSSSEFYISVMYDEEKSRKHSQHQVPFSPPESHDLSIELEEGVVKLTASKFLELFSFIAMEKPNDCVEECSRNPISVFDGNQKVTSTPKVLSKEKTKEVDGRTKNVTKGLETSESRKRKYEEASMSSHDRRSAGKSSKSASNSSNLSRSSLSKVRNVTNEELPVERVAEACSYVTKGDLENLEEDSLMTYAVIGCVDSEDVHAKEDEGAERFLPLKKRRTTTEEAPVKFQADGDGANNNPGMFFQLNGMEIEDFLSKVHGDGS